jgi:hypothetical protein
MAVQPASFNEHELLRASKYAQVVAFLNPEASADDVVRTLRNRENFDEWQDLEKRGAVVRHIDEIVDVRTT